MVKQNVKALICLIPTCYTQGNGCLKRLIDFLNLSQKNERIGTQVEIHIYPLENLLLYSSFKKDLYSELVP